MALWLTLVVTLTCFGGFASPGPVPSPFTALRELIKELNNITQKGPLCNGSMVWNVNLTANPVPSKLRELLSLPSSSGPHVTTQTHHLQASVSLLL
ncbi:Interleukin-13 [Pteropus alecto]|uniref:Interleukin-13 n=1 Tax=Pteropus alecto TaxID=9402 RepID=L5JVM4_PTEAL|nr:Interleukin-13 [Pteropus alecto]